MAGLIQSKMAPGEELEPPEEEMGEAPQAEAAEEAAETPEQEAAEPAAEEAQEKADGTEQGGMDKITPESITAQLHLSAKQKPQLDRIVVAGMKVMFSPKTHDMMLEQIDAEGPIDQKLGMSVAGLMGLLMKESNNSLPPDMIVPAGIVLLVHAADFLEKSGTPISDQDIAAGISVMMRALLKQFGMDPDKVAEVGGRALNPNEEAEPAPEPGGEPAVEPPVGTIAGAMQ